MEDYVDSDEDLKSVLARFPQEDMGKASLTAPSIGYSHNHLPHLLTAVTSDVPRPTKQVRSSLSTSQDLVQITSFLLLISLLTFVLQGMAVDISV